jgi:hypothetical protein
MAHSEGTGPLPEIVARLGLDEIGRRYIAMHQADIQALRDAPDPRRVKRVRRSAEDEWINDAVWIGEDSDGSQLPTELRWQLVMAAFHACPIDDDGTLWFLGDGPFDHLATEPGITERVLALRETDPKVQRLFAAMRAQPGTGGWWLT